MLSLPFRSSLSNFVHILAKNPVYFNHFILTCTCVFLKKSKFNSYFSGYTSFSFPKIPAFPALKILQVFSAACS